MPIQNIEQKARPRKNIQRKEETRKTLYTCRAYGNSQNKQLKHLKTKLKKGQAEKIRGDGLLMKHTETSLLDGKGSETKKKPQVVQSGKKKTKPTNVKAKTTLQTGDQTGKRISEMGVGCVNKQKEERHRE